MLPPPCRHRDPLALAGTDGRASASGSPPSTPPRVGRAPLTPPRVGRDRWAVHRDAVCCGDGSCAPPRMYAVPGQRTPMRMPKLRVLAAIPLHRCARQGMVGGFLTAPFCRTTRVSKHLYRCCRCRSVHKDAVTAIAMPSSKDAGVAAAGPSSKDAVTAIAMPSSKDAGVAAATHSRVSKI